ASLLDSYLSDRMQAVVVGTARSDPIAAMSRVAQGSILGPHILSAFITSVLNLQQSKNARHIGYADDIILVKPIASSNDCWHLQDDIDKILAEYTKLLLQLNPAKTRILLATFSPDPSQVKLDVVPRLAGEEIEQKSQSDNLVWNLITNLISVPTLSFEQPRLRLRAIGALWRILGKWTTRRNFC
ncbi:MAG: hypothetical protein GY696_40115, partial [Gammaproteobacteria bacterium]|nr:hypothetical protein [Gammaproteobacteria bacterium]